MVREGAFTGRSSKPIGPIRPDWWNERWIPIVANLSGDLVCVDMDPAPGGVEGQFIEWGHETGAYGVLAENFAEWLSGVVEDIEDGFFEPHGYCS